MKWLNDKENFISVFSIGLLAVLTILPFLSLILLITKKSKLNEQSMKDKIGALYEEIDTSRKASLIYNVLFMTRRFIYAFSLVVMRGQPYWQLVLLHM
jgi:hypothetical protein